MIYCPRQQYSCQLQQRADTSWHEQQHVAKTNKTLKHDTESKSNYELTTHLFKISNIERSMNRNTHMSSVRFKRQTALRERCECSQLIKINKTTMTKPTTTIFTYTTYDARAEIGVMATLSIAKLSSFPFESRSVYTRTVNFPPTDSASHSAAADASLYLPPHSLEPMLQRNLCLQHSSLFTLMYAFSLSLQ